MEMTGLSSSGKERGPFVPTVKFYDLINPDGVDSMDYEIRWVSDWFTVADSGDGTGPPPVVEEEKLIQGTLGPAETRNFEVSLTLAADELTVRDYSERLKFTNLTTSRAGGRDTGSTRQPACGIREHRRHRRAVHAE